MKTIFAFLLLAVSAFAAASADEPAPPPAALPLPPPLTWHVWGYKWDGSRFAKQPDHCLNTTDLQQAVDYYNEVMSHHDWSTANDLPMTCITRLEYYDSSYPIGVVEGDPIFYAKKKLSVWVYELVDGKWVKNEQYSHDDLIGLETAYLYLNRVNAIPGWKAVTNCPPEIPADKQKVFKGAVVDFPWPYWFTMENGTRTFHWNDGTVYYYHHHH